MCGICGRLNFDGRAVDRDLIERMCAVIQHRGPDHQGTHVEGEVGIGYRRLSIIDLAGSDQPIHNEDHTIQLVFNGEIYNFLELRPYLQKKGHRFYTQGDAETIVHLYEERGEACVEELRGMFAFALWDAKRQRLLVARDRVGKKPLYYTVRDGSLLFASEIKSLLQDPAQPRRVNLTSVHHYLTLQYVPAPDTIFEGIKELPPAHTLLCEGGQVRLRRYWDLSFVPKTKVSWDELRAAIEEATRIRLVSDVPLGVFLSGGLDSSAIVAIMTSLTDQPVKTFSIGFDEKEFDELSYARRVAEHLGTDHHEFIFTARATDILPTLVWHFDQPLADPSAIPTYYLSKMTREFVTVALTGDGGDEIFAGYQRYFADPWADLYRLVPAPVRQGLLDRLLNLLPESTSRPIETSLFLGLRRLTQAASLPSEASIVRWGSFFNEEMKSACYSAWMREHADGHDSLDILKSTFARASGGGRLDRTQYVDIGNYLPGDLLVKADRMSMAVSLELRSPFLDHKLMELVARWPVRSKVRGMTSKYALRKVIEDLLPPEIVWRKKRGFGVPIGAWLRDELRDDAYALLLDPRAVGRGYFDPARIEAMLDEHVAGQINHGKRIWALMTLELWHQLFVDTDPAEWSGMSAYRNSTVRGC